MHKRIVKAIIEAISQHDDKLLDFVIHDKPTGGFWELDVKTKEGSHQLLYHIEAIGKNIGRFYGENLDITIGLHEIRFS